LVSKKKFLLLLSEGRLDVGLEISTSPSAFFGIYIYRRFDLKWTEASRKMQRFNAFSGAV